MVTMNPKFGTIKNPLTIIAIFAGIAEVSGTAILPFLKIQNQTLYVWFLMLFPFVIVLLFFATLNWNYKVLYAPSDFQNEDHFIDILGKASKIEVLSKADMEAEELVPSTEEDEKEKTNEDSIITGNLQVTLGDVSLQAGGTNSTLSINELLEKLGLLNDEISNKANREIRNKVLQGLQRKLMRESRIAEELAIGKLEKEFGVPVDTEIKINLGKDTYVFDGVIRQNNKLTAVETRFFRDASRVSTIGILRNIRGQLESVYGQLSEEQQKDFSLIFVLVTDVVDEKAVARIEFELKKLPFPVIVKCYEFDRLVDELIRKVT
jgi:hypothetical protein